VTADQVIRLITAVSGLLGVVVWPALVLVVIIRFRSGLADFFANIGEFSLKAPGLEATARKQQMEAAAALGAAEAAKPNTDTVGATRTPSEVAETIVGAVPNTRAQRRLQGRLVLWVDDRPDNNYYERQALEALGVRFVLSTSTDDALRQIRDQRFDLIISDMGRPPDSQAGYTLLDNLRRQGNSTPFIIYAGSRSPEHQAEARRRGAQGCTNSPNELISIATRVLVAPNIHA
jgi:CheY-like chemotaxis protein